MTLPQGEGEGLGRPPKETEEQPHPAPPPGATGGAWPGVSGSGQRSQQLASFGEGLVVADSGKLEVRNEVRGSNVQG